MYNSDHDFNKFFVSAYNTALHLQLVSVLCVGFPEPISTNCPIYYSNDLLCPKVPDVF